MICPVCNGVGDIQEECLSCPVDDQFMDEPCEVCDDAGFIYIKCTDCDGDGFIVEKGL